MKLNKSQTVSQFVSQVKNNLESSFRQVHIVGEVSNLSLSSSGHYYFTLSDSDASISMVLFRGDAMRNPIIKKLEDGAKVVCLGGVSVYTKRGTFQVIVKQINVEGEGDLKIQYEKLKQKLAAEGLFDQENKKEIPHFPKRVAVITAERGAALQDFLNIYKRRSSQMDLVLIPSLVQGDEAPASLRKALFNTIKYSLQASEEKKIDLIVITRGGGSIEDLWSFNDEALAWDIFNCPIPVISAVGHQVDFTICDFVADLRCETPSAAAEIITQYQKELTERLNTSRKYILSLADSFLKDHKQKLSDGSPKSLLGLIREKQAKYSRKLEMASPMRRAHELTNLYNYLMRLDDLLSRLSSSLKNYLPLRLKALESHYNVLKVLDPKNILSRGYSYVETEDKKIIRNSKEFKELDAGSRLSLTFCDGDGIVEKV